MAEKSATTDDTNKISIVRQTAANIKATRTKSSRPSNQVLGELRSKEPNLRQLQFFGAQFSDSVIVALKAPAELIKLNSSSATLYQNYGSFLINVMNDHLKGKEMLRQAELLAEQVKRRNENVDDSEFDALNLFSDLNTTRVLMRHTPHQMCDLKTAPVTSYTSSAARVVRLVYSPLVNETGENKRRIHLLLTTIPPRSRAKDPFNPDVLARRKGQKQTSESARGGETMAPKLSLTGGKNVSMSPSKDSENAELGAAELDSQGVRKNRIEEPKRRKDDSGAGVCPERDRAGSWGRVGIGLCEGWVESEERARTVALFGGIKSRRGRG
ncbi:hypothetical protein M427DRAFT_142020 [Gonapodya prolifera JEL478]|uniref:TmcB/TmcC TPR repeats domain-containing protein n=1 Tax=Gonapodya prolifera (strain JEL478) TaxID=1344416 RepID=A0A139AXP8_GONPJ|nr:hypothetical protein M427DRAFT_142020 [Gonapodya prolifera JEL478]|eukprot:KXS21516.1 hypothetical protein M427DRAFT_142020 [Gonapodya prolifera JEL478]